MAEIFKEAIRIGWASIWTRILTVVAILMLIAAAICPPMFVIDSSILYAVGEIFGFGALLNFSYAIERGMNARVKKGDMEVNITKDEKPNSEDDLNNID